MFRRDQFLLSVSSAARQRFAMQDALRGYVPEPPALRPVSLLAVPSQRAAARARGSGGDAIYAHRLVRDYGPTRALLTARAEGREGAAALIEAGLARC